MFVRKSKYEEMEQVARRFLREAKENERLLWELRHRWNGLVDRINALGGEDFLKRGNTPNPLDFSAEDVQRLIQLCHPDKHDGKALAVEMTQKLLRLRERLAP